MITRLLLRFGFALVRLDLVARILAAETMRGQDVSMLEMHGTQKELRRKYALVALETGLPNEAQDKVGEMAWAYIAAARDEKPQPQVRREGFSFYR